MPTPFSLTTPLPPDTLRFEAMTHVSALSTLGDTRLQLLSDKATVDPDKLLGQLVELQVVLREGGKRHLSGYVTRFGIDRHQGRYFGYQAELRPWLWFLTRTSDCRIFQDKTVREIVELVFKDHAAIANYEFKLTRSYRKRVYCVQYRETDFNFVARLLEDEGIYWFFRHEAGSHKLVIADSAAAHQPMPGDRKLPYFDNAGQAPPDIEYVSHWNFARSVKAGKSALSSYDFEKPSSALLVTQAASATHDQGRSGSLRLRRRLQRQGRWPAAVRRPARRTAVPHRQHDRAQQRAGAGQRADLHPGNATRAPTRTPNTSARSWR